MSSDSRTTTERLLVDFSLLEDILSKTPQTMAIELAETCFEFFSKHGKLEQFIDWAIKKEVQRTKYYGELFREETFGVTVLRRIMTDDMGIQFLQRLLSGVCRDIITYRKPLTIVQNFSGETPKEVLENISYLLQCVDRFLDLFAKNAPKCPKAFRQLLVTIQSAVAEKFPGEGHLLFISNILCFYFICPALINPKKYGVVRVFPDYASIGIINVSKIINDIALNAVDRVRHPLIIEYIHKKHTEIQKIVALYANPNDIENSVVLNKSNSFGADEKKAISKRFQQILDDLFGNSGEQSPESYRISEEDALKAFDEKINNPGWKKYEEKKFYTAYSLKDAEVSIVAIKSTSMIKATIESAVNTLKALNSSKDWNTYLENFQVIYANGNYSENYASMKPPFPLSKRDLVYSEHVIKVSDKRTVFVHQSLPKTVYPSSGYIRSFLLVGGWNFEVDKSNSEMLRITYIMHNIPGGSVPAWVINVASKIEAKRVKALIEVLTKKSS